MALQKCGLNRNNKIKNFSRMAHWNFLVRVMNQHIQMLSVILFPGTGMKNLKSFTSSKAV